MRLMVQQVQLYATKQMIASVPLFIIQKRHPRASAVCVQSKMAPRLMCDDEDSLVKGWTGKPHVSSQSVGQTSIPYCVRLCVKAFHMQVKVKDELGYSRLDLVPRGQRLNSGDFVKDGSGFSEALAFPSTARARLNLCLFVPLKQLASDMEYSRRFREGRRA
jgi:hypothetical protein